MADSLPRTIGNQIIKARASRGWTQGDLSEKTAIPQGTISRYESGERRGIHPENLMRIADATGVSVDFLLGRKETDISERIRHSKVLADLGEQYAETVSEIARITGVTVEYLLAEC